MLLLLALACDLACDPSGAPSDSKDAANTDDTGAGDTADTAPTGHADAQVNPDAAELCDAVDNNCDGATDESTATDAAT